MVNTHENRYVQVITPAAIVDNASPATVEIDRVVNGVVFDYVDVLVTLGATDTALTVLKMQHSDTTGADFVDFPETVYGAANKPALPAATDDNKIYAFHINCINKKRFLKLSLTVGDGAAGGYVSALAILSRGKESPDSAAARGLAGEVFA